MATYKQYAPEFAIRLDGELMPAALRGSVVSVSYQDGIQGADRVELTIANPSLRWLDHPLLDVDTPFALSMGYAPDPLEEVFVGEITGVEPSFPSGGMPTIRVTAQDYLNRLTKGGKHSAFAINIPSVGNFPLPDAAVASIVSARNLLIPNPDPVGGALSVLLTLGSFLSFPGFGQPQVRRQEGSSDFDLLTKVARENGWEVFIDHTQNPKGRVLKFQFLIQQYTPSVTLDYGASLLDFTPRLTTIGDVGAVTTTVWVDNLQMQFTIAVSWDYDQACFNLVIYPTVTGDLKNLLGTSIQGETLSVDTSNYGTAARSILSELLPRLNNRLTGSGNCVGNPEIKASRVIRLNNLGDQFSGSYRVTQATHTFDGSGYRTSFQARKEVWFGAIPLPKAGRVVKVRGEFAAGPGS